MDLIGLFTKEALTNKEMSHIEDELSKNDVNVAFTSQTRIDASDVDLNIVLDPSLDLDDLEVRDSFDIILLEKEDEAIIKKWVGTNHIKVLEDGPRSDAIIKAILFHLGIPKSLEIERKFLIEYPDIDLLTKNYIMCPVDIAQYYIKNESANERVRKRGNKDHAMYFHTIKKRLSDTTRLEIESRISEEEYLKTIEGMTSKKYITKTRYLIYYKKRYFEMDIFPFWDDKALLEIELEDENEFVEYPDLINIIKEVSDDDSYNNSNLTRFMEAIE